MKSFLLAAAIVLLGGGVSYLVSQSNIRRDKETGSAIAQERAEQRKRMQEDTERTHQLLGILRTLEDSLTARPADSMLVISAANICYDLGKFEKAAEYYRRFLTTIDPSATAVRIDFAYALFRTGNTEGGIRELQSIIAKEPRNQSALLNMAVLYAQLEQLDTAKEWFQRCAKADSTSELGRRAQLALSQLEQTQ